MITRTITVGDTEFTALTDNLRARVNQHDANAKAKQATPEEVFEAQRNIAILGSVINQLEQEN